jgi:Skp family chaperone for outer membrane proteins
MLSATVVAAVMLAAVPAAAQQLSVAYVDVPEIINQSERAEALRQQLRNEFMRELDDLKKEQADLAERNDEVGRHRATLSDEQWEELREVLEEEKIRIDRKTEDLERAVQVRRTELFNAFEKQVLDTIEEVRAERKLGIIFAKGSSGFLAVDPALNLTDEVMARVDGTS